MMFSWGPTNSISPPTTFPPLILIHTIMMFSWGPTEWGPIPFLPENDILVTRMEKQWGELRGYR